MAEKIYSRLKYYMAEVQYVKAHSLEEAQQKFNNDHEDIITNDDGIECEDYSQPMEEEDLEVEEVYSL